MTDNSKKLYVLNRMRLYIAAFFVVLIINFVIPRLMPGTPATQFVGPGFSEQARQEILREFGLTKPLWEQFVLYLVNTLTGNFGVSTSHYPTEVMTLIMNRLPRTLYLMSSAVVISIGAGIPLGAISAWNFGKRKDIFITQTSLFFRSIPSFWLGILLIFLFGYLIPIFPISGAVGTEIRLSNLDEYLINLTWHTALPVATLTAYFLAGYVFLMRGSLLDVLPENYIKIAETKGLSDRRVLFNHAVPPAFPPVLTQLGFQIGRLIGGAVLIETVFGYPGIGNLMFQAVLARDYPVLQATFFFLTLTVLFTMFVAELLYVVIDPRVGES